MASLAFPALDTTDTVTVSPFLTEILCIVIKARYAVFEKSSDIDFPFNFTWAVTVLV